jgi:hypothetical protein
VLLQVSEQLLSSLPKDFFEYRKKRVFQLATHDVKAIEIAYPRTNTTHRFELKDDDWKPVEKIEVRPLKLEDLLYAIASLDAQSLEPANADKKALGLESPATLVRALGDKDALLGELALGDASPDKGIPAQSTQTPELWRVSNNLGKEVPLSPEAFANTWLKKEGESP